MKAKFFALAISGILSTLANAAEPDTQVIEYYHPPLNHYFITASATDARLVDSGAAGIDWVRTGRSFGAWSTRDSAPQGAAMVYRFYSPGANSHFYTASNDDVQLLRGMEASERATIAGTSKPFFGWVYEGEVFLTILPTNGQCPARTESISRVYNSGNAAREGSNHRYLSDDALKKSMEDRKWAFEAAVFCSPSSLASGSSSASGAATSGSFSGTAQFKYEETGKPEVKSRLPLALVLDTDGALSGSGGGCSFAGSVSTSGDGRLRGGSVSASGCSDVRFNGNYSRVEIEQFGAKTIDIRIRQGDNAREASVEGVLTAGTAVASPTPAALPTPPAANSSLIAGDFSGVSTWLITERFFGQSESIVFNVNQSLTLKISSAGVVSGTGQGCTFAGTLTPAVDNRYAGQVNASGCTNSRLNGNYTATVHPEDGGAIDAELEREIELGGVRTKVSIEGNLLRSSTGTTPAPTPTPTPPSTGLAIAGSYAGNASWLATRRPSGGKEATVVDKSQAWTLTLGSNGAVTGSGAGCTFSGALASSNALLGTFAGSITASGCTDSIISGAFTATATRENSGALQIELERETEINGERVKVKIKGLLMK